MKHFLRMLVDRKTMKGGVYEESTLDRLVNQDGYIKDINEFEEDPNTDVLAEDPITLEPIKRKEAIVLDGQVYSAYSVYNLLKNCQNKRRCMVPHSRRPLGVREIIDVYRILSRIESHPEFDVHYYGILIATVDKYDKYEKVRYADYVMYFKQVGDKLYANSHIERTQDTAQKTFNNFVDEFMNKNNEGKRAFVMMDLVTDKKWYNSNISTSAKDLVDKLIYRSIYNDNITDPYEFLVSDNVYEDFPMVFKRDNSMGGEAKTKYKGKMYKVRLGPKGGKYITVGKDKKKIYVN